MQQSLEKVEKRRLAALPVEEPALAAVSHVRKAKRLAMNTPVLRFVFNSGDRSYFGKCASRLTGLQDDCGITSDAFVPRRLGSPGFGQQIDEVADFRRQITTGRINDADRWSVQSMGFENGLEPASA